jgi:hypothetical protein
MPPDWGVQAFLNDPEAEELEWVKGTITYELRCKGRPEIKLFIGDYRRIAELDFSPIGTDRTDVTPEDKIAAKVEKLDRLAATINSFVAEAKIALYGWGDAQPLPAPEG